MQDSCVEQYKLEADEEDEKKKECWVERRQKTV